jgi:hypothetical protein
LQEKADEMRKHCSVFIMMVMSLPALFLANVPLSGTATSPTQRFLQQNLTTRTLRTVNIDGDLSLNPEQNRMIWNAHSVGLTNVSDWRITFTDEAEMHLKTVTTEAGHIATGAWWTTSFEPKEKLSIYALRPVNIAASFRINIITADLNSGKEWLRVALACAIQRSDSSVVYTEMDLWDSPIVLTHPSGNTGLGGIIVYRGGNVVEYKIDQVAMLQWRNCALNLTQYINDAWQLKPGDVLESVYFVVEAAGAVTTIVRADDLLIMRLE